MKRSLMATEARRILARVPLNVSFWLCTNEQLKSLDELSRALGRVTDEVFRYHVNRDKNDFENWIREIINDRELAREISRIKTRDTLVRKITERVEELRKAVKKPLKKIPVRKAPAKKAPARRRALKKARRRTGR
ncbi:hypothetical protein HYY74_00395 [Candidatus Woesearchaeota archaeon]|nr:hypothetical protein [Candidatus Woesearchaeota archaeon]